MPPLLLAGLGLAQAAEALTWTPSAQLRPRLEVRSGPEGSSSFVSQRARVGVDVAAGPQGARVSLQDVRTSSGTTGSARARAS